MEYTISKPFIHGKKLRHFRNAISLSLKPNRVQELTEYATACGIAADGMRISFVGGLRAYDVIDWPQPAHVSFRNKKRAMLFKLAWTECQPDSIQDMLNRLRTALPHLMAQHISGVQPMTFPYPTIVPAAPPTSSSDSNGESSL